MTNQEGQVSRALRRAGGAFDAFRSATALDLAHDAWEDFLVYWHRAVNKIELAGESHNGAKWLRIQVWADPTLKYLRLARNAGDHGLSPVMQKVQRGASDPGFMMDIGGGVGISPRGRVGAVLADGLGMEFVSEALELAAVHTDRGDVCDPPMDGDKPMRALDVGEIGLAFLTRAAASVS